MAVPAKILPDDQAIVPLDASNLDGWAVKINCDPAKDWSGSTFTVDPAPFEVDDTHKVDGEPYVLVFLTPAELRTLVASNRFVHWNIAEDVILGRTFFTQRIVLVRR